MDRMKRYESYFTGTKIDPSKPFVMRLDGHSFSKFTKGLKKPYDYNFHKAFSNTAMALQKEYNADLAYTHSDEISLLFYPKKTKKGDEWREPIFGGRVLKIVSTSAAFCTMVFNRELVNIFKDIKDEYKNNEPTYERMMNSQAYFDSRIFQLPNDDEMFSYIFSRSQVDCKRNHVFELSREYYAKGELHKKGTNEKIKMLAEKGIEWDKEPACFRRGSFFKRVKKVLDEGQIRSQYMEVDIELKKFDEKINEMLKCEYIE